MSTEQAASADNNNNNSKPILPPLKRATAVLVVGMAGSGKSTFAARLAKESDMRYDRAQATHPDLDNQGGGSYVVNLDPAAMDVAYEPNVDIRDTVDYKQVMEQYSLGPNGGILTALNLFATKFDQVLGILERRADSVDQIVMDTPGQIEIFTWSASGALITSAMQSSAIPTVVAYVIDTPRTTSPATFMSNMLYACSIMYKTRLPFVLVFNKTDEQDWSFARNWMDDFEAYQQALADAGDPTTPAVALGPAGSTGPTPVRNRPADDDGHYMNSLMNSMALVLDEFYSTLNVRGHEPFFALRCVAEHLDNGLTQLRDLSLSLFFFFVLLMQQAVGVSSTTGEGFDDLFNALDKAREEFVTEVRPSVELRAAERQARLDKEKTRGLQRLMRDMDLTPSASQGKEEAQGSDEDEDVADEEIEQEYEGDGQIIDPDPDEEKPDTAFNYLSRPGLTPGRAYGTDGTVWPRTQ